MSRVEGPEWGVVGIAVALIIVLIANLVEMQRIDTALLAAGKAQTAALTQAKKAEVQLNALARGTQALAAAGNPNAAAILAVLRQNGVQIAPAPAPAG